MHEPLLSLPVFSVSLCKDLEQVIHAQLLSAINLLSYDRACISELRNTVVLCIRRVSPGSQS